LLNPSGDLYGNGEIRVVVEDAWTRADIPFFPSLQGLFGFLAQDEMVLMRDHTIAQWVVSLEMPCDRG
jgi:hypothetical protein